MKIKWFSRLFAVLIVATMLMVSCLSITALTLTAPEVPETSDNAYSFSFEDGVLTIRVNPDKIYNMLRDGNVSIEELREFIPDDILAAMEENGELELDDLRALAAECISVEDLKSLVDQLPIEIVREYFSLDMITELDIFDDMFDILPIDDMLAEVDPNAFRPLLNDEVMKKLLANKKLKDEFKNLALTADVIDTLVTGDNPLITKEVAADVFKDKLDTLVTDSVVESLLEDDAFLDGVFSDTVLINNILTESVIVQIADGGYVDHLISPQEALATIDLDEALTALGISVDRIFNDCVDPADYQDIYSAYGADFTAQELLDGGFITLGQVIAEYDITARKLVEEDVLDAQDIRSLVGDGAIKTVIRDNSEARAILKDSLAGNAAVDVDDYWKHIDIKKLVKLVGSDEVAKIVANDVELLDRLCARVAPMKMLDAGGIDVVDIIEAAGGAEAVLKFYTLGEIKAIASAVDREALASFIENDLFAIVDIKEIAHDVIDFVRERSAEFKRFAKVLLDQTATMFVAEVDYVSVNGAYFYEREYAMFDLNTLFEQIIAALPNFDTFTQLGTDAIIASFDVAISVRGTEFELGVEFGYLGDPTNLNNLLESKAHLFKLDIADDNSIRIQTSTPDVLAEIYKELLETDTLSADLRNKLASIPLESLENAIELLQELSEEERQAIVDALAGKLDDIREAAYDRIEAEHGNEPAVFSPRRVFFNARNNEVDPAVKASQEKVDSIINSFSSVEGLETAVDDMAQTLDFIASDQLKGSALVDLYDSNGNFAVGSDISFDVLELTNKVVTVPEELQLFLMSTEVSVDTSYDVTVDGLFGVEVALEDGSTFATILPTGVDVAKLQDVPVLEGFAQGIMDEDLNSILYMPEGDIKAYSAEFYSIQFVANGTVLDTIIYPYGEEYVETPEIPEEYERIGYTVDWERFSLNQVQRLTVELDYTPIIYQAKFVSHNRTEIVKFTIEDIENGQFKNPAKIPTVGAKIGYTGAWETFTLGLEDITINAVYTINFYTATFKVSGVEVDSVVFTVEDIENGQFKDLTKIPSIESRLGYTSAWEPYTLGASDITINAVYTATEYVATFKSFGKTDYVKFTILDIENGQFKNPAKIPTVGDKPGYTGVWETFSLGLNNVTINAVYTIDVYTATFISYNKTDTVRFTVDDIENGRFKDASKVPALGARLGYTGVWEEYSLGLSDVTINAVYTIDVYTATFVSHNKTDTVRFTIDDIENGRFQDASKVPALGAKLGYTGVWEEYSLGLRNITINAVYTIDVYTATFESYNKTNRVTFTIDDIENGQFKNSAKVPTVGAKVGYTGVWEEYTLELSDITINAEYTIIEYTATFKANGQTVGRPITFTVNNISTSGKLQGVNIPEVPSAVGFTGAWENYRINPLAPADIVIEAEYTPIEYTATFTGNGQTISVKFTVLHISNGQLFEVVIPRVPAKVGYDGEWAAYTLDASAPASFTVQAVYVAIEYTATFIADGEVVDTLIFTVEDESITPPAVPAKTGYTGVWDDYRLIADDIEIEAVYTAIEYTATFKADGVVVDTVTFTIEDTSITEPAVPSKVGYTGAWEAYTLGAGNITINARYTAEVYTATFMADGVVVATVTFTVENTAIAEPTVPEKAGFTGAWEPYELSASDITINAVYTAIGGATTTAAPTSTTGKPSSSGGATDADEDEVTQKAPIVDKVDELVKEGTFAWWILLVVAAVIIIGITIFLIFKPKDDDDGDDTPPTAPVVEEVSNTRASARSAATLANVVYKDSGSTAGYMAIVNLGAINDAFSDGDKVNIETLKAKGLVPAKTKRVKILADGRLDKHGLEVEANSFSAQAIKMITLTGGTAVQKR